VIKLPQFWFEPVANRFEDTCLVALIGDAVFTTVGAGTLSFLVSTSGALETTGTAFLVSSAYPPKIEIEVLPPGGA
jgi:hypothetical protein